MSEGVFQSIAKQEPYEDLISKIDSCGTGKTLHSLSTLNDVETLSSHANVRGKKQATTQAKSQTTAQWPLSVRTG